MSSNTRVNLFVFGVIGLCVGFILFLVWLNPRYEGRPQAALKTRDVFAIHAMQGIANAIYLHKAVVPMEAVAKESYRMADAMLKARDMDLKVVTPRIEVEVCPDEGCEQPKADAIILDGNWGI